MAAESVTTLIPLEDFQRRFGGISRATAWRRIAAGELPAPVKLGGRALWVEAEVEAAVRRLMAQREPARELAS